MAKKMTMRRRRERRRKIEAAKRLLRYAGLALLTLAVVAGVWKLGSFALEKISSKNKIVDVQAQGTNELQAVQITGTDGVTGWNVDENGWWYQSDGGVRYMSGWQTIEGQSYYFTDAGYMATGWQSIDGEPVYFSADGIKDDSVAPKLVAVTFDDGPSKNTDRLLDILEENNAKATFFEVGTQIQEYSDATVRAASMGMEIGSHTYDHTYLTQVDAATIATNMQQNDDVIQGLIGTAPILMRPTGGGVNDTVRATVQKPMINWDVDTLDWKTRDAEQTIDAIQSQVQDGSIILMHDLYSTTVDACETAIPWLVSQGYQLVTVSELAQARGITLQTGNVYYDFYPGSDGLH